MLYGLMGIICDIIVEPPAAGLYSTRKASIKPLYSYDICPILLLIFEVCLVLDCIAYTTIIVHSAIQFVQANYIVPLRIKRYS
jgi:hypothetical protein